MMALRARYRFNPRVPSGTKKKIYFRLMPIFIPTLHLSFSIYNFSSFKVNSFGKHTDMGQ